MPPGASFGRLGRSFSRAFSSRSRRFSSSSAATRASSRATSRFSSSAERASGSGRGGEDMALTDHARAPRESPRSTTSHLPPGLSDRVHTNGHYDVFVRDRERGTTERVSVGTGGAQGDGDSFVSPPYAISAAGRFVAFVSYATNLVPGDTDGRRDVFVRDRKL